MEGWSRVTILSGTSHPVSVQGNEVSNNSQYLKKVRNFCALEVLKPINDHLVYSIFVNSAMTLMSLSYLVERTNWKKKLSILYYRLW